MKSKKHAVDPLPFFPQNSISKNRVAIFLFMNVVNKQKDILSDLRQIDMHLFFFLSFYLS